MRFPSTVVLLASTLAPAFGQDTKPVLDPNAGGPAQRVWSRDMQNSPEVWLRRQVKIPKGAKSLRLLASCDNEFTVYINGDPVASSNDWQQLTVIDIDSPRAGDNVIAVHGKNTDGPASFVLWMAFLDASGDRHEVVTDKNWRITNALVAGWEAVKFDDSKWEAAREQGEVPYARNVYGYSPTRHQFVNRFSDAATAIERGLTAMRRAGDDKAALRALNEIERAIMEARRKIQARRAR